MSSFCDAAGCSAWYRQRARRFESSIPRRTFFLGGEPIRSVGSKVVVVDGGGGGGGIGWLIVVVVGAFSVSLAGIEMSIESSIFMIIITISLINKKNGTVEPNDIRYKEDIVILSTKNVRANKISVLCKNIVIAQIVISRFHCIDKMTRSI